MPQTLFEALYEREVFVGGVSRADGCVFENADLALSDVASLYIGRHELELMAKTMDFMLQRLGSCIVHDLPVYVSFVARKVGDGGSECAEQFRTCCIRHPLGVGIVVEANQQTIAVTIVTRLHAAGHVTVHCLLV